MLRLDSRSRIEYGTSQVGNDILRLHSGQAGVGGWWVAPTLQDCELKAFLNIPFANAFSSR
jgi:hypothetical protein